MLPITLEPKPQISLFPKHSANGSGFELEVVTREQCSEIHLYFLTDKKEKAPKPRKRKSISKCETMFLF